MNTRKVVLGSTVKNQKKDAATIASLKGSSKQYPAVSNPDTLANAKVTETRKGATQWDKNSPFHLEDFKTNSSDYRGRGLLPSVKMNGNRVID